MNIEKNNKLIAEFIEVYCQQKGWDYLKIGNKGVSYHTSWDWLMPVIEKIGIIIGKDNFEDLEDWEDYYVLWNEVSLLYFNIEIWYKHVIEFIKWYNKQNKEKMK